jgi:hypothetical protein
MERHEAPRIVETLSRIDAALTAACDIVVIGGAAIALSHDASHATTDIDLFQAGEPFWEAHQAVRRLWPAAVPIERAAVADAPYSFEDRLRLLDVGTRKLRVWVPERHDLTMMKTMRGYDHDLQGIEDIHRSDPLDLDTLLTRYREMTHVVGPPERLRGNVLAVVARLWGEDRAVSLEARL